MNIPKAASGFLLAAFTLVTLAVTMRPVVADDLVFDTAVLRGLDKVTGRVQIINAPVGVDVHFGSLDIVARSCRKHPPEDQPEAAAFLDIFDQHPGEAAVNLFRGWMFASSPALSALENPVYDVWVIDCSNSNDRGSAGGSR